MKRGQKGNTFKPETYFIKICKYEEGKFFDHSVLSRPMKSQS